VNEIGFMTCSSCIHKGTTTGARGRSVSVRAPFSVFPQTCGFR
jgi:hypothetical protein